MIIYIERNFALARIERKKKRFTTFIYEQSSATKNFTNFTITNHIASCEQWRKNNETIFVKEYKKFSSIIYYIYIWRERERERKPRKTNETVQFQGNKPEEDLTQIVLKATNSLYRM